MTETGIPCFKCSKRSGTDCPGRKKDEATLCDPCFRVKMLVDRGSEAQHLLNQLNEGTLSLKDFYYLVKD
jgi:hypothetical protein